MGELRFRDDAPVTEPTVAIGAFAQNTNASAVRLEPGDDARELLAHLDRLRLIEIAFPTFGDGRGYSAARILREAGYIGEMRAVGDVLVDQLGAMRRCGFDSFVPQVPFDQADVQTALDRWPHVYQPAADECVPIWTLRHG